jgi:hypothetical protein
MKTALYMRGDVRGGDPLGKVRFGTVVGGGPMMAILLTAAGMGMEWNSAMSHQRNNFH